MSMTNKMNVPPLEPWKPSSVVRDAISGVRDEMERLRCDLQTAKASLASTRAKLHSYERSREVLIFLLHDEFMSNGGYFQSTEADCVFRQTFAEIDDPYASNMEIFTRLLKNKPTTLND